MEQLAVTSNITQDRINNSTHMQLRNLIESFSKNRKIDDPAYHILICLYSILIIVGATGNSLVVMAVARKPNMRTARNMFIVNLAISGEWRVQWFVS
jgi:neuropeptide F receptor